MNGNTEVLDADGNIISGFYAAGEVSGKIHGTNRIGGNAVPDALYSGKIASANAAKN
ncbi:MAG: FAD-binding protein [Lachnospiraceae bacterium]|nr:FAD-binding protein [Lachnospiraceae bacterium]